MKPKDHVYQYFDLSTAHVPNLADPDFGDFRSMAHEFGWVVWIHSDAYEGFDIPDWFKPIVALAQELSCFLILFDRDAKVCEVLPTFEH